METFRDSALNFLDLERFVSNIYRNKKKYLAPLTIYFSLKIWLQACFIMPACSYKLVAF